MENNFKFFKGSVTEFKDWLILLSNDKSEEGKIKYDDVKKSVIYISENYDKLPEELDNFIGAIYAQGAIISSGSSKWDNSDVSVFPPID